MFGEQGYLFDIYHDSVIISRKEELFREINEFIRNQDTESSLLNTVHSDFIHAYCLEGGFMKASMSLVVEILMSKILKFTLDVAIDYITHNLGM